MGRGRAPGDGLGPTSRTFPRNNYLVFWKSPGHPEKGTIWLWCSPEMTTHAGLRSDEDIPFRSLGYRPALLIARGINWTAAWDDGTTHSFKASPQITRTLMAQLAQRCSVPPATLQREKGRPFDLASLVEESHSHVYLVRLLTFDPTADGRAYYKIGKAISIPKRIKQFGPCELVAETRLPSEKESLTAEAQLHQQFAPWRKPETEIFCFSTAQLEVVKTAMAVVSGD
jgi:hypothetical protein